MPTEFVRIRDKETNTESSVPRRRAAQLAGRGVVDLLDVKAVNALGEPLPATPPQADPPSGTAAQVVAGSKSKEQAR